MKTEPHGSLDCGSRRGDVLRRRAQWQEEPAVGHDTRSEHSPAETRRAGTVVGDVGREIAGSHGRSRHKCLDR